MVNRLNGWQRIGVVIAVVWVFFVSGIAIRDLINRDGVFVTVIPAQFKIIKGQEPRCTKPAPPRSPDRKTYSIEEVFYNCSPGALVGGSPDKKIQISTEQHHFRFVIFMLVVLAPPVLLWLSTYILIGVIGWVAKGFRKAT